MAVSGAGGWIPSCGAILRDGHLDLDPITQNKPRWIVVDDMSMAADLLRSRPDRRVQIDVRGGNITRLRGYLIQSGHVKEDA